MILNAIVDDIIRKRFEEFNETVSKELNIPLKKLKSLYEENVSRETPSKARCETPSKARRETPDDDKVNITKTDQIIDERIFKYTVPELKNLCKEKKLKCGGKKSELISRLLGKEVTDEQIKESITTKSKVSTKNENRNYSKVVEKLKQTIPTILIRRNAFNNYEHPPSGLVFNSDKYVYGKQKDDGSIDTDLTYDDIQTCKRYKFKFIMPENLEKNLSLENVHIDELDELEKGEASVEEGESEEEDEDE